MKRPESRQEKLERLAARVTSGEAVFFIGAGFSLESERNSAQVLIARLLARLEALTEKIGQAFAAERRVMDATDDIRRGLRRTFWLKPSDPRGSLFDITLPKEPAGSPSILKSNLETLSRNYYLINDWACSSFEKLIALLAENPPVEAVLRQLATEVNDCENQLLDQFHAIDPFKNTRHLSPVDFPWLIGLHQYVRSPEVHRPVAGKALFLETLGFLDPEVMAGAPWNPSVEVAVKRTAKRLGTRHHVLAWLAAEGLSTTLVTTNYDMLVESAYRAAGLLPANPPLARWGADSLPPLDAALSARLPINARVPCYTRIASAVDFFANGRALQSALVHKIHGCVDAYRIARESGNYAMAKSVLPTIVFTFREIQNWRDDAWSRDYLSTLLRTRTVVFAGYSGADPVVHDTFRTVYEEMARQNEPLAFAHVPTREAARGTVPGSRARAFFLDQEVQREFYALEILRSAGLAENDPSPDLSGHANLLTFFTSRDTVFPNLDELFLWLYHLVARDLQGCALVSQLPRLAVQLFGRPCPESEARRIRESFAELRQRENDHASRVFEAGAKERSADSVRRRFASWTGWTSGFLKQLMREFELGMTLLRKPGDSYPVQAISRLPWYRPITEHPDWAAWAAVVELAIRRLTAVSMQRPGLWKRPGPHLEVAARPVPAVLFRAGPFGPGDRRAPVRRCLSIQLTTLRQLFREDDMPAQFTALEPILWKLRPGAAPWWPDSDPRRPQSTPSASMIWQWATKPWEQWPPEASPAAVFAPESAAAAGRA